MKLFIILSSLFGCGNSLAAQADKADSIYFYSIAQKIDSNIYKIGNRCNDLPKFILSAIKKKSKIKFKITDNEKKYTQIDIQGGTRKINRVLLSIAKTSNSIILIYEFGGFITNMHMLLIKYEGKNVTAIYNFVIPKYDRFNLLSVFLKSPSAYLKQTDFF